MKFDKYTRTARIYPAIISVFPLILLSIGITNKELDQFFEGISSIKILGNISFALVMIYLLSQTNRFIAKNLFEKSYFKSERFMPTTNFLLYQNKELSNEYKDKVRQRIRRDFNIQLLSRQEEESNISEARQKTVEAVGLVRNNVGDGRLLLQHNIEYGFVRNLIGGAVIGSMGSAAALLYYLKYYPSTVFWSISLTGLIFFISLLLGSKALMNRYGELYAKRLFQEYLTSN